MILGVENAEIMKLLGMGASELDIPLRYSMFEEVSKHFGDNPKGRQKILSILSKTPSKDGLEAVWRYVRLHNEKASTIKSLDPSEFEDDISKELKEGALSLASIKRVEEDMAKREKLIKPEEINDADSPVVKEAMKFHEIKKKFDIVKEINGALEYYGD